MLSRNKPSASRSPTPELIGGNERGKLFTIDRSKIRRPTFEFAKEDIIGETTGRFGRWHIWICYVIFSANVTNTMIEMSFIFLTPPINFTCADANTSRCANNCTKHVFDRSVFLQTINSEWDLVCDKQYLENVASEILYVGYMLGAIIFGRLIDRYGRRKPLIIASLIQVATGGMCPFTPWFEQFVAIRFFLAIATGGIMCISYVVLVESIGKHLRTTMTILFQAPHLLAILCLVLISFYFRNWRMYHILISASAVDLVVGSVFLPESPLWLMTVGKKEKAIKILSKPGNRINLSGETVQSIVETYCSETDIANSLKQKPANVMDLIRRPIIRKFSLCIYYHCLAFGLCYEGLWHRIYFLEGGIYNNIIFFALLLVPSLLFSLYSIQVWGRRPTLIFSNAIVALSYYVASLLAVEPVWLQPVLTISGIFGVNIWYIMTYIYTGEVFPTCVRGIAVGIFLFIFMFGEAIAMGICELNEVMIWIPPAVFGTAALCAAVVTIWMPETMDSILPNTLAETEDLQRYCKY